MVSEGDREIENIETMDTVDVTVIWCYWYGYCYEIPNTPLWLNVTRYIMIIHWMFWHKET